MSIQVADPLGLCDRNMQDSNVAYQTFVSDAEALDAMTRSWYITYRELSGQPGAPALSDLHHGYWRGISREVYTLGFRTLRQAYNDAWPIPLSAQPGTGGGGGNGPIAGAITVHGKNFRVNGAPWSWIGASDFCLLQNELVDGTDPGAVLEQRASLGFNVLRVWGMGDWGDGRYRLYPQEHGQRYFDVLRSQIERARALGMFYEFTLFADTPRVMPSQREQLEFYSRVQEVLIDLGELVNENSLSINRIDTGMFQPPRPGLLMSRGSNAANETPVHPVWTHGTYHPARDWDWALEVGHHAMEWANHYGVPVVSNENKRPDQAGFKTKEFYDGAANGALLSPGSTYHCEAGKLSELFTGPELECARAWVEGARAIPLEFQDGSYTAGHLHDCPVEQRAEWAQQTYGRILGGRACVAYMYATPECQVVPRSGWRVVEQKPGPVVILER